MRRRLALKGSFSAICSIFSTFFCGISRIFHGFSAMFLGFVLGIS